MVGLRCISLATLALNDALLVRGFAVAPHNIIAHTRTFVDKPSFQRNNLLLHSRGNDEEDASLDLDQTVSASAASAAADYSLNVTVAVDPSNFVNQSRDNSVSGGISVFSSRNVIAIVSVAALLALSQVPQTRVLATVIITTYSKLLAEYPLPTKSLTSGLLCGVSDAIAQFREANRKQFNFQRWIRFAGKGCVGGVIWACWYDELDGFLDQDNKFNFFKLSGIVTDQWIKPYLGAFKTILSILIEQFLWCPIVFGFFEIPVSTLLNGGDLSSVKKEVDSKLGSLLISNAKIWTFANLLIYGVIPVDYRPIISNIVDVGWQSIVSSVSADCGKVDDDICIVNVNDFNSLVLTSTGSDDEDKDLAFYAEKSRF
eukprot:scaffold15845_cov114-Skeletonema_dohrnii-CCMP3373.AAC.3